jgi:sortase A
MKIEERHEVIELSDRDAGEPRLHSAALPETATAAARHTGKARRRVAFAFLGIAALIAAFLAFEFALSGLSEARSQRLLLTQFKALSDQGVASTLDWLPQPGQPVGILSVPRLGLQSVVVEGTSSSETAKGPGHFAGSPLPGRPGNSVIAGRRTSYGGPFARLGELQPGDTIQMTTGVGTFTYIVSGLTYVHPNDLDVLNPTSDNRLTLMTSDPPYRASGRLVATAALQGLPARQHLEPAVVIPADQVGLTGEPWAFAPLLLWLELFGGVLIGALWFRRRISSRVAWLFGSPLAVALLWAIFSSLSRLLPATL